MRKKVWNLVIICGLMALSCGIYLFTNNGIEESWALEVDTTSSACFEGGKFVSQAAAETYCKSLGYTLTKSTGTTSTGELCYSCDRLVTTCQTLAGYYNTKEEAITACGGEKYVSGSKKLINGVYYPCYSCNKEVIAIDPIRCSEKYPSSCLTKETCEVASGIWIPEFNHCVSRSNASACKGELFGSLKKADLYCLQEGYSGAEEIGTRSDGKVCAICVKRQETCQSKYGEYDSTAAAIAACGEKKVSGKKRKLNGSYKVCYSCPHELVVSPTKCSPKTVESCNTLISCKIVGGVWNNNTCTKTDSNFCINKGYFATAPECPDGYKSVKISSYKSNYYWTCYSKCKLDVSSNNELICQQHGLFYERPVCSNGQVSRAQIGYLANRGVCYTKCMDPKNSFLFDFGTETKIATSTKASESKTSSVSVTINNISESGYYVKFVPVGEDIASYSTNWIKADSSYTATANLSADTYYVYVKNPDGEEFLVDKITVNVSANNTIIGLEVGGEISSKYYGSNLTTISTQTVSEHTVIAPQSRTSGTKDAFQMLSANKKEYGIKLIGDSKTDKTLTVDPETGLLVYTLSEEEKASLGITTEKVYVVASKEETRLTRNADGTFTKSETGDTLAGSKNELGTIYKITPKNDISAMSEYIFYGINLAYIENADYSNSNTWNDIKLLSYNNTTTADTDFTFEIVRNGYSEVVKQLSSSNKDYKIVPLASSTTDNLGTFYIDFSSDVTQYEFSIDDDEITLNPVLVYTDSKYVEGYGPRTVKLNYGLNVEYIKVESSKGAIRTYTLLITRMDSRSSDNTLSSLVARNVDLTPTFTKYTNEYYGTVVNSVKRVEIAAEKSSNEATFVEGYGSRTVDLKVGENTILVKVKSETEAERTYKIIITREGKPEEVIIDKTKSANNNLKALYISSGNLMFDGKVLNYNLYVTNDITNILVTPTLEDEKATYVINKGQSLQIGANKIEVVVTAENGETKTYTINVIRKEAGLAISTDSTLSTLQIKGENINFSPTKYLYNVTIFPGTEELKFYLEPSNEKAQIEVIGNQELSDFTTVKIKVIAEDGSYSIYDVNVKVDDITKEEIIIFAGCAVLFLGLVVFGTISRNKKKKNNL